MVIVLLYMVCSSCDDAFPYSDDKLGKTDAYTCNTIDAK